MVIWLTGLSGAGKTTIGRKVFEDIKERYNNTIFLDGDIIREILGSYGYERANRLELAKKISNLCYFMEKQNINVVCSTISLFREIHELNRERFDEYYEIFIDVNFEELIRRDQKGLYTGAAAGIIKNVVGVDIQYDIPQKPDLVIDNNHVESLDNNIEQILKLVNL